MLDLSQVELDELASALEDHSLNGAWFLHPDTGEVEYVPEFSDDERDLDGEDLVRVDSLDSRESYGDMEDFIARVGDPRARELLERAVAGRGAFRRFKDTLFEFPELREAWFKFHDARMRRRAVRWLADEGLVDEVAAERAIAEIREPDVPGGLPDAIRIASEVAEDLRSFYRERFRGLVLFGSHARGDANDESDIDLLVLLDRVDNPWVETDAMQDVLYRRSLWSGGVFISGFAVAEEEFEHPTLRVVYNAKREGRRIA